MTGLYQPYHITPNKPSAIARPIPIFISCTLVVNKRTVEQKDDKKKERAKK